MNLTTAQLSALAQTMPPEQRAAIEAQLRPHPGITPLHQPAPATQGGISALRQSRPTPGRMTKTESLYALRLDAMKLAGQVTDWNYETDRLKLANPAGGQSRAKWYKMDFTVYHPEARISFDETKGSWQSQTGMERFRWLCDRYPFRWLRLWVYERGVWDLRLESGK